MYAFKERWEWLQEHAEFKEKVGQWFCKKTGERIRSISALHPLWTTGFACGVREKIRVVYHFCRRCGIDPPRIVGDPIYLEEAEKRLVEVEL